MIGTIIYNLFCRVYHYFIPQKYEVVNTFSMDSFDIEEDNEEIYGGTPVEGSTTPVS